MLVSEDEYRKAFSEVLNILKYIPNEQRKKIPKDIISILKEYQDLNYQYQLDFEKDLKEQKISKITQVILAIFYRDYWAKKEDRENILEKENNERKMIEEEKRKKYNPDNLFKNKLL